MTYPAAIILYSYFLILLAIGCGIIGCVTTCLTCCIAAFTVRWDGDFASNFRFASLVSIVLFFANSVRITMSGRECNSLSGRLYRLRPNRRRCQRDRRKKRERRSEK